MTSQASNRKTTDNRIFSKMNLPTFGGHGVKGVSGGDLSSAPVMPRSARFSVGSIRSAGFAVVPTQEGWLYLAVVEDLDSRRVVGWSMGATMESRLVVDALEMAVKQRFPDAGLVAHSDRGSQSTSITNGHWPRRASPAA